ncbi:MAG: response regulator transcription factor [Bryobacterales bacterium]|nr:response regulator transcription factor [Bryobacterales bacterium]
MLIDSQPDMEVVSEARTGREAVEQARKLKPDIVIMDVSMPELNGIEGTRQFETCWR